MKNKDESREPEDQAKENNGSIVCIFGVTDALAGSLGCGAGYKQRQPSQGQDQGIFGKHWDLQ